MIVMNDSHNTNDNQKTRFDSRQQESSKSHNSNESEPEAMDDNFFVGNDNMNKMSKSFKKKRENPLSFKAANRISAQMSLRNT